MSDTLEVSNDGQFVGTNMAKKSYQARVREQREQDILATAARLIHEQGFTNLNMDVLADEVGISKSTLYQHFNSKEDMVRRVLLKGFDELDAHLTQPEDDPLNQLEALIRYVLTQGYAPDGFATTLVHTEIMNLFQTHDEIRAHMGASYQRINQIIDAGKAQGQIRAELSNAAIVSSMFALISTMDSPRVLNDDQDTAQLVDDIVSIWLRGIRA